MKSIYILLFSFVLFACGNPEKTTEIIDETAINSTLITISKKQFESEKMAFGQLSEQAFYTTVKTTGIIDVPPENKASVSTFIGGYITKIPLLIGDKVKKGQLVASLQNTEFVEIQQQYLEITAQLSYLKNEYERQKTLFDELITSEKNYLKAESNYKSNLATYNGLRKKLEMMHINPTAVEQGEISSTINLYAPISGFVTKVNVSNGSYISSADELLEIINTDHIHLELNVFEKDILGIKKHQKIQFKIPEASNKIFDAEVYLVGTFVNTDRTIKVHGHINDDENSNFITGMFIEASIISDVSKEISLPKSAILESESNYFALVLKDENTDSYRFEKIKITIGLQEENYVEIKNHQQLKDQKILTKGLSMF
ncbi:MULTISPECIES: efflux RND transporter periplasmic adaptor subunit [unclassified Polaribacter]|uniref:efflux RND transporter periplasmic adaptor subunit n=1 Tax=unclassified Polaribacter TaxID=196858 RepID=UPI0011BFD3A9|nr:MULTISPECIES: efflux RND transporter periplasmic adaptor subunit [unclassified Polaribacter]TXD52176.1 efflux RND transporter periplasmic adaptor subunit [Polaribacter sp. IC063]TXD60110.1 efflux RND transporter periplasmic adaptor subunit [Polaribacter sp. IC066]